jgi:hypothetical protein
MDWRNMTDEQMDEAMRIKREADHRERERILNEVRAVYVERGGLFYVCQCASPMGWHCGHCLAPSFGREPTIGMTCECGAMVKDIARGPGRTMTNTLLC